MTKTRVFSLAAVFAALLFLLALPASAQCDPTTDPSCRLSPLQSRQVNPAAQQSDGTTTEFEASGAPETVQSSELPLVTASSISLSSSTAGSSELRVQSPELGVQGTEPGASSSASGAPSFSSLDLRMRYQDPSDVSCGVQALGMALAGVAGDGLEAPASSALLGFLQGQGMMYDFGTGVEELAYAAGSFGFKGTQPFHGWILADLRAELVEGRPVVVALGSNGEGVPGHFVTVTGISDDGQWISYNDPTLGKVTKSIDEFNTLWGAQGNSGVSVRSPSSVPAEAPDNLPLLALMAGIMALVSATPMGRLRQGVGGKIVQGSGGANPNAPPHPAPAGKRWKAVSKDVYDWRNVEVEDFEIVPITRTERVQVGTRIVYESIPKFKTITVQKGHRWEKYSVPKYKTVTYVKGYRYQTRRVPSYRGWRYIRQRVPVYGSKRIRVGTETKWRKVSKYVKKEVPDGFAKTPSEVPIYETRTVTIGHQRMPVTRTERKYVKVGTETEWVLEDVPSPPAPPPEPVITPEPTQTPTATPSPSQQPPQAVPVQTPEPDGTPAPYSSNNQATLPSPREVASWLAGDGKRYFGFARSAYKTFGVLGAAKELSIEEIEGTLRIFGPRTARDSLNWHRMTNWLRPENESQLHLSPASAARKSVTSGGLALGLGLNIGADTIKFMNGEYDRFEYAAALTVDTGFSIGVAALAGAVAGAVSGVVAGFVGGSLTVPVVGSVPGAVVGGVAGAIAGISLGIGASIYFNSDGRKDNVVEAVANLYRDWVLENDNPPAPDPGFSAP